MSAGKEKRARRDEIVGRGTGAETLGGAGGRRALEARRASIPAFGHRLNS